MPKEFLCAINGHVMKEPVRSATTGLVYEKATIELWLQTRGAVCPITNMHLERGELEVDEGLRTRYDLFDVCAVGAMCAVLYSCVCMFVLVSSI